MLKLSKKYEPILATSLMSWMMSGVISLSLTFLKEGFANYLLNHWLKTWIISFAIALPVAFLTSKFIKKLLTILPFEE